MRPVVYSITDASAAAKTSAVCPLDLYISPSNVALGIVVSGTVNYTVQYTFDDVFDSTVTPTAFPHSTLASQTANKDGNYAFPVQGIRLTQTGGNGSAQLTVLQSGMPGR